MHASGGQSGKAYGVLLLGNHSEGGYSETPGTEMLQELRGGPGLWEQNSGPVQNNSVSWAPGSSPRWCGSQIISGHMALVGWG